MIKISSSRSSKWPSLSGCHSVLFEAIREEQRQQPNRLSGDNGELSLVVNEENSKEVIASSASSEFKLRMVRFICEDGQVFIHGFLIASASGLLGQALIVSVKLFVNMSGKVPNDSRWAAVVRNNLLIID